MLEDKAIASQLEALLTPAITSQENYYRQLGLRERILNLPLMVAAVLTLLWRDVAGVTELTRILAREGFLWCNPTQVSQQAVAKRFLTFPAELFERVLKDLLPYLKLSWEKRKHRPNPESVEFTLSKFDKIWIVGSINGIKLQIWATWLFYAVLMDLGDAVADELSLPVEHISLEMIYRGLYHFSVARQKGLTDNPIQYFAASENQDLGIVKSLRKTPVRLIIAPFPERQKNSRLFFFSSSSQTPLTTGIQA